MASDYQTFTMIWQERTIRVAWQVNWLNTQHTHIELRCDDLLPVTETGYRSEFVCVSEVPDEAFICAYVTAWLDDAGSSKAWKKRVEQSRQLSLF